MTETSLYIHIPFCESKCGYCAFSSTTSLRLLDDYFKALAHDIAHELSGFFALRGDFRLTSVYFGGGTPSAVAASYFEPIFAAFSAYLAPNAEISAEANPSSLEAFWLDTMRSFGLNRISIGVQSFIPQKLAKLGRKHTAQEAFSAIELARKKLDNVSIDLIYATPWDEPDIELRELAALGLSHFSAYTLLIESNTPFARRGIPEAEPESTIGFYRALCEILPPYEASNFASPGCECRHNLRYWDASEYLGCGLSAVGALKLPGTKRLQRRKAAQKLLEYINDAHARVLEDISADEYKLERLFLGLRSSCGVPVAYANASRLKIAKNEGLVRVKSGQIYALDYLLADEIALFLSV